MKSACITSRFISWVLLVYLSVVSSSFSSEKITFYHYDLLGSPVAATNEKGEVLWREEYSPYGNKLLIQDAMSDNARGYTGHVHDTETGLTYMQARYFDPEIGRFMGIDPVGFKTEDPVSFNRYVYGNNNPYRYIDPNGEWSTEAHNYFIDKFSEKHDFSSSAVRSIKSGSKYADSLKFQFGDSAHMHAMGNGVNSVREQSLKMNNFIAKKMNSYKRLLEKAEVASSKRAGRMKSPRARLTDKAYHDLGMALHAVMDSTSPAHKGFQVWSWSRETVYRHGNFNKSIENLEAAQSEINTKDTLDAMESVMSE